MKSTLLRSCHPLKKELGVLLFVALFRKIAMVALDEQPRVLFDDSLSLEQKN